MDQCPNAESYLNPARAGYQAQLKVTLGILGFIQISDPGSIQRRGEEQEEEEKEEK